MRLQPEVEQEIQAVEQWVESLPGQKAGPSRLRGLRSVLETQQFEIIRKAAKLESLVLELQERMNANSNRYIQVLRALRLADKLLEQVADQQAMPDDSWRAEWTKMKNELEME